MWASRGNPCPAGLRSLRSWHECYPEGPTPDRCAGSRRGAELPSRAAHPRGGSIMIARGRAGLVVGLVAAVIAGAAPAARAQSTAPAAPTVGPTLAAAGAGVRAHVAAVS